MIPEIDFEKPRVSPLDDDLITFTFLNRNSKATIEVDHSLFTGKWFDYRHMTPLQATSHYIACFGVIYRQMYATNIDRERAEHVKTDTLETLIADMKNDEKSTKARTRFTGYWRGRQVADALGMPYEVYIDLAIDFRLRYWNQRYLPRPDHLYDDRDIDRIATRWQEIQESRLYLAQHPTYLTHNYVGAAHQNDYHEWLFDQADKRSGKEQLLADFVGNYALPLEKVRARLPEHEVERVEAYLH